MMQVPRFDSEPIDNEITFKSVHLPTKEFRGNTSTSTELFRNTNDNIHNNVK